MQNEAEVVQAPIVPEPIVPPEQMPTTAAVPASAKSKWPLVLILIVILLGIFAGGYFLLMPKTNPDPVMKEQMVSPTQTPPSPTPDEAPDSVNPEVLLRELDQTELETLEPDLTELNSLVEQL